MAFRANVWLVSLAADLYSVPVKCGRGKREKDSRDPGLMKEKAMQFHFVKVMKPVLFD